MRAWMSMAALGAGLLLAQGATATSSSKGAFEGDEHRVEAELVFDVDQAAPGETIRVGVLFRMAPEWHIYWRNAGESGLSSEVEFEGEGLTFSPLQWPFPKTFRTAGDFIVTYGYDEEVLLFAEAQVGEAATGPLQVEAEADVLVCKVDCIPAQMTLRRTLPFGPGLAPSSDAPLFQRFAARVPTKLEGVFASLEPRGDREVAGSLGPLPEGWRPAGRDAFVPDLSPGFASLRSAANEEAIHVEGALALEAEEPPRALGVAHLLGPRGDSRFVEIDAPLQAAPEPVATETAALPWILLLAFGGGALLNLMPCVFPVLAVKAYGFARIAHESRRQITLHAVAYTVGVVGSLLALGVAVVLAKAAGVGVGWGFQFQHPLFVAFVASLVVAFALNLFGVFQVSLGAAPLLDKVEASQGLWRSAGEGVLAVVLATPCTAPLLGTAVGFAFAAPASTTLLVFAVLGLGLAAPFCLLILMPGLAKRLPKPGPWMERFKHGLGFALLGTAAWLVWVMGGLGGVDAMAGLIAFLVAVAVACWIFGLVQYGRFRKVGLGSAAGILALTGWIFLSPAEAREASPSASLGESWSDEAVRSALAEGKPVFVDFTADWCLTCKFNERTVLASQRVREAFDERGVTILVGDWTRRDETIRQKLASHGKAGVPLYLLYDPERPDEPEVLPELLTEQMIIDSLARLESGHKR